MFGQLLLNKQSWVKNNNNKTNKKQNKTKTKTRLSGLSSKRYKGEVSLNSLRWRLQSPATSAFLFVCFTLCVCVCECARTLARLYTTGTDMQPYYVLT